MIELIIAFLLIALTFRGAYIAIVNGRTRWSYFWMVAMLVSWLLFLCFLVLRMWQVLGG